MYADSMQTIIPARNAIINRRECPLVKSNEIAKGTVKHIKTFSAYIISQFLLHRIEHEKKRDRICKHGQIVIKIRRQEHGQFRP